MSSSNSPINQSDFITGSIELAMALLATLEGANYGSPGFRSLELPEERMESSRLAFDRLLEAGIGRPSPFVKAVAFTDFYELIVREQHSSWFTSTGDVKHWSQLDP